MSSASPKESVADYSGYDFAAQWTGRDRVTEVERAIVREMLRGADGRRLLEVGSGFGRLSEAIAANAHEVVELDFDIGSLAGLPSRIGGLVPWKVAANLYHLPFVDRAFTGATLIRVYHHLSDPVAALREIARILQPGARLLVSYSPTPSIGTLVKDLQRPNVRTGPTRSMGSYTLGRPSNAPDGGPFPIHVPRRREFWDVADAAGFVSGPEIASGLEEYRPLQHLPASWFVRFGAVFRTVPGMPTRFATLVKRGDAEADLPAIERMLACPRCVRPLPTPLAGPRIDCDHCGPVGARSADLLDLRYVPEGARRWSARA